MASSSHYVGCNQLFKEASACLSGEFQQMRHNRLQEKDRLSKELRQSSNYAIEHKDALLNVANDSNVQEQEGDLNELRSLHQLRVQDLYDSLQHHQYQEFVLVVAMVVPVFALMIGFIHIFATQTKEKLGLEAQNHQYECNTKEKIACQENQYGSIIMEKTGRIEQLEREQEQQRTDQQQVSLPSSLVMPQMRSSHLPSIYAFSGMPPIASCGATNNLGVITKIYA